MSMTVGEVLKLSGETRAALAKAQDLLDRLTDGGTSKPAALGLMAEPTLRIKERLEDDLAELDRLAAELGL